MKRGFTRLILFAMVAGIAVGYACHAAFPDPQTAKTVAGYISLVADVFLRLIKMIIAPLVFTTLVVGVAHMGDGKSVGRIGAKTMLWFVTASLASLVLGMIMVNILRPGDNIGLPIPDASASTSLKVSSLTLKEFIIHLVPRSVVESMATNEILQIVVFALFFGIAASAIGERAKAAVQVIDDIAHIMLKVTGYVMALAPLAVFAAIAATITTQGIGILWTYGKFLGGFYFSLLLLWLLLFAAGYVFLGPPIRKLA